MMYDILHKELVQTIIKNNNVYETYIAWDINQIGYITLYYINGELDSIHV